MKKLLLLFVVLPLVVGCDSDKLEYMRRVIQKIII